MKIKSETQEMKTSVEF